MEASSARGPNICSFGSSARVPRLGCATVHGPRRPLRALLVPSQLSVRPNEQDVRCTKKRCRCKCMPVKDQFCPVIPAELSEQALEMTRMGDCSEKHDLGFNNRRELDWKYQQDRLTSDLAVAALHDLESKAVDLQNSKLAEVLHNIELELEAAIAELERTETEQKQRGQLHGTHETDDLPPSTSTQVCLGDPLTSGEDLKIDALMEALGEKKELEVVSTSGRLGREEEEQQETFKLKIWALFLLGVAYVHQSTTGFSLPAMLPMISPELNLTDFQGAMLTSGYSYLYALALIPVGLIADKTHRPKLLALGMLLWSGLSMLAASTTNFKDLLLARIGFAAAQAAQNPVSFSLIPDLFPQNKSTALAIYNCAIYLGRALSFAAVLAAGSLGHLGESTDLSGNVQMVPLDRLDLQQMSVLYTSGDTAFVTPIYNYNFHVIDYEYDHPMHGSPWRTILTMLGIPGIFLAGVMFFTMREPRDDEASKRTRKGGPSEGAGQPPVGDPIETAAAALSGAVSEVAEAISDSFKGPGSTTTTMASSSSAAVALSNINAVGTSVGPVAAVRQGYQGSPSEAISTLLGDSAFMATTLAAALNDVGSYGLIAWHSTFYERIFHLESSVYAPMLAAILPVGGVLGGVGGGMVADWLTKVGGRYWITAGASIMAAPFIAESLLADTSQESFVALLIGFGLSEAWRAPSAVMIRSIAPSEIGSTASAMYLCVRNLVGGIGPLAIAGLSSVLGLQRAMLLVPGCYIASGLLFLVAEYLVVQKEKAKQ